MKIMSEIIHIDEMVTKCGHFTSETTVNNCYGCTHPNQEEQDKELYDDWKVEPHDPTHAGAGYLVVESSSGNVFQK